MATEEQLLHRFVEQRDENAFRELVDRHAGLVLGTAGRALAGNESAQDVAQQVFTLLARKAGQLHRSQHASLRGWLHRTTLLTAANELRTARRRSAHLRAFAEEMKIGLQTKTGNDSVQEALQHLDAAIDSLSAADREVLLGHFYEGSTFRELAIRSGRTEDAVQKRAARALPKLGAFFRRRGIVISAATLLSEMSARVAEAVPPAFAAQAAATALKTAPSLSAASLFANTLATMTLTKLTAASAIAAFFLPFGWRWLNAPAGPLSRGSPTTPVQASPQGALLSGPSSIPPGLEESVPVPPTTVNVLADEISKLETGKDQLQLLRVKRLILELPAADLPGALQLVMGVSSGYAIELSQAVFGRWGETDPQAGLVAARTPSFVKWRSGKLDNNSSMLPLGLFETWVLQDSARAFAAAKEWDAAQPPGSHETPGMLTALAGRDPLQALELAASMEDKTVRRRAISDIQQAWALQDPEAALRWISDHAADETRPDDIAFTLRSITASQPDRALELALTLENPHARLEALDFTLHNWAVDQPQAALEAMLKLPDEALSPSIVRHATIFLAGEDFAAMAKAADRLPEGERREVFVEVVAISWAGDAAERAAWLSRAAISSEAKTKIQNLLTHP